MQPPSAQRSPHWFVAGTDTGIGKTRVAVALLTALRLRGLRAVGMKPVASGCEPTAEGLRNPDALALIAASSGAVDYADVNPFAFQPAIAPHLAARIEGRSIDLDLIEHAFHRLATTGTHLVVEGAGGWRVPLDGRSFMSEIPRRLALDVVLVVGLRLGCLNHALLTAEAVRADGLHLAGWVGNAIDPDFAHFDGNVATLHAVLRAPCLGIVPWEINPSADHLAGRLDLEPLLDEVVRPATAPGGKS